MTRTETTIRWMLADTDPLDAGYGLDVESGARAAVSLTRILATSTTRAAGAGASPAHRAPRTRAANAGRIVLAGSTALVVGAVVVTATTVTLQEGPRSTSGAPVPSASTSTNPSGSSSPSSGGAIVARPAALVIASDTDETARDALLRIAKAAEESTDTWEPATAAKPYTFRQTQGWYGQDDNLNAPPKERYQWVRAGGAGRILERPLGVPANPTEPAPTVTPGTPLDIRSGINARFPAGEEGLSDGRSGRLPVTVAGLESLLKPNGPVWDGRQMLMAVEDVYSAQVPEPAVRAALLRMLAASPDVTLRGTTVDRADRAGLAFSAKNLDRSGALQTLVIDEKTGIVLDAELTLAERGPYDPAAWKVGDVLSYTVYLGFGRVATDTELPEQIRAS